MPKKAIYFTSRKKHIQETSKKSLHCCEPVLLCAFNAQNRVQFALAKHMEILSCIRTKQA